MSDRQDGRPNILILMTDEHAAQFAGTYGHPFIATPGMDRLASEGVTFDAAYCNNPLCVPSRLSFMTGRYTHRCGGWDNSTALPVDAVTWPYALRAQGYEVVLSGKMHLIGPDRLHGFERQLAVDLHADLVHPVYRWAEGVPEAARALARRDAHRVTGARARPRLRQGGRRRCPDGAAGGDRPRHDAGERGRRPGRGASDRVPALARGCRCAVRPLRRPDRPSLPVRGAGTVLLAVLPRARRPP